MQPGPQILHLHSDGLGWTVSSLVDKGLGLLVVSPDNQAQASVPLNHIGLCCLTLGDFDNFLLKHHIPTPWAIPLLFIWVLGALVGSKDEPTQLWCSRSLACNRVRFLFQPSRILTSRSLACSGILFLFQPSRILTFLCGPQSGFPEAEPARVQPMLSLRHRYPLFLTCIPLLLASLLESLSSFQGFIPFLEPFSHLH